MEHHHPLRRPRAATLRLSSAPPENEMNFSELKINKLSELKFLRIKIKNEINMKLIY